MFGFGSILALAAGLAMDATAVAAARGFAAPSLRARDVLLVALFFGGFQALMPLLGYVLGEQLGAIAAEWDHWIAFVLLAGIGAKMLWEARGGEDEAAVSRDLFGLRVLLVLAIATSIDAFAAGITLPMIGAPLALTITTIGAVTALSSVFGLFAGRRFGALIGKRFEVFGGLALIGLGVKILIEHLA